MLDGTTSQDPVGMNLLPPRLQYNSWLAAMGPWEQSRDFVEKRNQSLIQSRAQLERLTGVQKFLLAVNVLTLATWTLPVTSASSELALIEAVIFSGITLFVFVNTWQLRTTLKHWDQVQKDIHPQAIERNLLKTGAFTKEDRLALWALWQRVVSRLRHNLDKTTEALAQTPRELNQIDHNLVNSLRQRQEQLMHELIHWIEHAPILEPTDFINPDNLGDRFAKAMATYETLNAQQPL